MDILAAVYLTLAALAVGFASWKRGVGDSGVVAGVLVVLSLVAGTTLSVWVLWPS